MLRLFDFECECGIQKECMVDIDEFIITCRDCGGQMKRMLPRININMGVGPYGYYDETLGKYISTNKQRLEECRKQEVTPMGDTPKPDGEAWV